MDENRVRAQFEEFSRISGIKISEQAQSLLFFCLDAIESDPHPAWGIDRNYLPRLSDEMTLRLPNFLFEIIHSRRVHRDTLTTFEVLHWLGSNLDDICPIEKDESRV